MRLAQRLLDDPALNVAEAARAAGYADPAYFSRVFRKHTGRSPRAYRSEATGDGPRD